MNAMNLLLIDTSSPICCVALDVAGVMYVRRESNVQRHSGHILQMMEAVQQEAGINFGQISGIVWNAGPGSFTGLRIGASICQALSFCKQIPVLPVSSLELLASAALQQYAAACDNKYLAVAVDARMNGLYWARFYCQHGKLLRIEEDCLVGSAELESRIMKEREVEKDWIFAGDGWHLLGCAITVLPAVNIEPELMVSLAISVQESSWSHEPEKCVPAYLTSATHWQKRQRKSI